MLQRAFFHIGTPKTGTSIIQSHLAQNRKGLRDMGFLYPITISSDESLYRTYESHHLLTYSLAGWDNFNRYSPDLFFELAEETAKENDIHTLLLSAENTYWLPRQIVGQELPEEDVYWDEKRKYIKNIYRYLGRYNCEIVIYLRRQDRWIESWFNQQVKNGNALISDMETFVNHHRWLVDYEKVLSIWSDVFGKENVRVRVYEKEQLPHGLFSDFCSVVGIDNPDALPLQKKARYNAQLDRDAVEFMNICNAIPMSPDQRWWFRMTARRVSQQFESQLVFHNQSLLSPEQRAEIVDRYEGMNKRIAKDYLGRDTPLFQEPKATRSADWNPYPGLSVEKAVEIVMQFVLELQKENASGGTRDTAGARPKSVEPEKVLDPEERAEQDRELWRAHIWDHE